MIHLLFVGDGARDAVTVPHLVERILGIPVREETRNWARLHKAAGSGYSRKLKFAIRQARDLAAAGLVAVVDADRDPKRERLKELRETRTAERASSPPFPTALGQAAPHGEAWLLDDPVAVRQVLDLTTSVDVPTVRKVKDCKAALESFWKQSRRAKDGVLEVWADIARGVDPHRYQHAAETGFQGFAEDVVSEFGSLIGKASDGG